MGLRVSAQESLVELEPEISPTESSSNEFSPVYEKNHRFHFMGTFLFGSGGDVIYSGMYRVPVGGGGELGYTYDDDFMRFSLSIMGHYAKLLYPYEKVESENDKSEINEELIQGTVFFSSIFSVWQGMDMNLKVGPGIHFYGDVWLFNMESDDIFWLTQFFNSGLGVEVFWDWDISPHRIVLGLYIPMFTVGWRPDYNIISLEQEEAWEKNGSTLKFLFFNPIFMSFHNFVFLNFRFNYEYTLTPSWSWQAAYQGFLQYSDYPRKRLDLHNRLQIGFAFHW